MKTNGTIGHYLVSTLYVTCGIFIGFFLQEKNLSRLKNKFLGIDSNDSYIEVLIKKRRSIYPKEYDPARTVPRNIIYRMLEAANWAPTHGKTEPWRFQVFSGKALRRLGEFDAQIYKKNTPDADYEESKYQKKIATKVGSSFAIAITMKRQKTEKIPEIEEIEAVASAVQNMHLVACEYQVGGYWSTGASVYSQEMKDFLNLEEKDQCLGFFCVGYPKNSSSLSKKGNRGDIGEKVKWIEE